MKLRKGYYFYIGSAFGPGGIRARVGRHLQHNKVLRWHIDYLRQKTHVVEIWVSYDNTALEKSWVENFSKCPDIEMPKHGFGASDSAAISHLFYSSEKPMNNKILELLPANNLQCVIEKPQIQIQ